jgi:Na+-driven multidrug efflux pump
VASCQASCCCCRCAFPCWLQGVYRGLADTRTPFYATLAANALNVVLGWAFIFGLGLGVKGAALATVTAQVSLRQAVAAFADVYCMIPAARAEPVSLSKEFCSRVCHIPQEP